MNAVREQSSELESVSAALRSTLRVGALATAALIDEPCVWPRFGLVGPDDPGGHRDMSYQDLVRSAQVLEPFFAESARLGLCLPGDAAEAVHVWRCHGLEAEERMYRATGGVNTHKGAIFLLGLLAFAWGRALREARHARGGDTSLPIVESAQVLDIAHRAIARTLAEEQQTHRAALSETYGQWAQRRFGWGGMRQTVIGNFKGLRRVLGFRQALDTLPVSSRLAVARTHLFIGSEDTNLLKRAGWRGTQDTLGQARRALRLGGALTVAGRRCLADLDRTLADKQWSASGAGDLLASFLFLDGLENGSLMTREQTSLLQQSPMEMA